MQPITFTNGNRIFTPSVQSQQALELTDLNGDGEIDILDAAIIASNQSNPGGIVIVNPPPPTIDDPFTPDVPFVEPQYCIEDSGIITTGCSSVYNSDGTINYPPAPEDPFFCPNGQVRGLSYDAESNSLRYISECTCPEPDSAVHAANILLVFAGGGAGKNAGKKITKTACIKAITAAEDAIHVTKKRALFLKRMNEATYDASRIYEPHIKELEALIKSTKAKMADGLPHTIAEIRDSQRQIDFWEREKNKMLNWIKRDNDTMAKIEEELRNLTKMLNQYQDVIDEWNQLLDALNNYDPERLLGILMTGLLPLGQFFVPKFCGAGSRINKETCECVPTSSGSYSISYTNNINISSGYNLIESL